MRILRLVQPVRIAETIRTPEAMMSKPSTLFIIS